MARPQQRGISAASLGPQGPGVQGPSAAMQAIQNMAQVNQQILQRSATNIQRMQQEADQRMAMQAQQMQSGVADVANQVAAGLEKRRQEQREREEKVENVQLQEDMMIFQQKLAQEAATEGQRIGTLMKNAQNATLAATEAWNVKRQEYRMGLNAAHANFSQMMKDGRFAEIPDGYKKADQIWKTLKQSEAYFEDQFNPSYLSHAARMLGDAERDIAEGRDPVDLAALYDRPTTTPYQQMKTSGTNAELSGKERFDLSIRGGYPKEGLYALSPDDPKVEHTRVVTPEYMAKMLLMEADYSSLVTDEARRKWMKAKMQSTNEGLQRLEQMASSYHQVSDMMFARAPEAIQRGLAKFTQDPRPGKFENIPENAVQQILTEMYSAEGTGPELIRFAQGVRDRTIELDTPAEFANAMHLEAAAAGIESQVMAVLASQAGAIGADEKGKVATPMSQMAEQWAMSVGPEGVEAVLGPGTVDVNGALTGVGLVKGQLHMRSLLQQTQEYAGELRRSLRESGAIQQFSTQFGTEARVADTLVFKWLDATASDRDKAREMLYGAGSPEAIAARGQELSLSELQETEVRPSEDLEMSKGVIDSTLEFLRTVKPSELPLAASLLSGGQVDLTDGRQQQFNAATQTAEQRSDYMKLVRTQLQDRRELIKQAKEARSQGTPWTPQQGLEVRKQQQSRRAQMAEQLRRAKGGRTGLLGNFNLGVSMLQAGFGRGPLANVAE